MNIVVELRKAGCVFAEDEAALLRAAASGGALTRLVRRRCAGEPLEPLLGWAEFRGRRLAVGPGVFVPRRRTEYLAALARIGIRTIDAAPVLVELCCGVAPIAATYPAVRCYAVDIDPATTEYARRNAPAATALVGDLFAPLPRHLRGWVSVVAANAPYVPTEEIAHLPSEARDHEPRIALDGGPDGLELHRRIAAQAPLWLEPGGRLLIETGRAQAPRTAGAMATAGLHTEIHRDEARDATVVCGRMPAWPPPQLR